MTRLGWTVLLGLLGIILIAIALFMWLQGRSPQQGQASLEATSTSTAVVNPSTLSIYTSGEYGFALFYPSTARVTDAYSSTTPAVVSWRSGAVATGTPIVSIKQGSEEVRVGLSTNQREVKACRQAGSSEHSQGSLTVGSTTWQKFSFQKLGTDNEAQVTSYRAVHASACYALELFQPLTQTASSTGYTLSETITSFSFAK